MYSDSNVVDDEGWSRDDDASSTGTFLANVRTDKLAEVQESYGIREDINIIISCAATVTSDNGDILGYSGQKYRVVEAISFDSHKLLFCQSWSSKSSISPSV